MTDAVQIVLARRPAGDVTADCFREETVSLSTPADAVTVGDGANDLPMLKAAGLGVAFHAKPAVAAEVAARIDHGDLTALLYLQGYRRSDFVERTDP